MNPPTVETAADENLYNGEAGTSINEGDAGEGLPVKRELPSVEDRECFLKCLACILTSSYKYDVSEADEETDTQGEEEEITGSDLPVTPTKSTESASSDEDMDITPGGRNDVSMFVEDNVADEFMEDARRRRDHTKNNSQENGIPSRKPWSSRFGRNKSESSENTDNCNNASNADSQSTRTLKIEQRYQRKRVSKAYQKLKLASKRHYKRRHTTACQLLKSACDLLLLDTEQSQQMYQTLEPQLEQLLTPRKASSPNPLNNKGASSSSPSRWRTSLSGSSGCNDDESGETEKSGDAEKTEEEDGTPTQVQQIQQQFLKQHEWMTEWDTQLAAELPHLTPGAGYRCLCWLLFQLLLNANNKRGYDARVRYVIKTLAVAVLVQDIERTLDYQDDDYQKWKINHYTTWVSFATRKFEQVEHAMAQRLIKLARASQQDALEGNGAQTNSVSLEDLDDLEDDVQVVSVKDEHNKKVKGARKQLVRGLKIGGVGVVAGTLLAVTGGMAAPAIAGALTFLGMGAVATTFVSLASTTAVVHIFGVAGGSLAAYKMRRRTAGLTEFQIVQSPITGGGSGRAKEQNEDPFNSSGSLETTKEKPRLAKWRERAKAFADRQMNQKSSNTDQDDSDMTPEQAELSRTICVSGWLTDRTDFQRPWGITPTEPRIKDKVEKLQRFYKLYNPDLIPMCKNLLKRWKNEENTFFELLEDKYGSNPDILFPLKFGPMHDAALTEEEEQLLDKLIIEIGEARGKQKESKHANLPEHVQSTIASGEPNIMESHGFHHAIDSNYSDDQFSATDRMTFDDDSIAFHETIAAESADQQGDGKTATIDHVQRHCYASVFEQVPPSKSLDKFFLPEHLQTVWDFSARYGGEVYTVHWESHMLMKLKECFGDVAILATASAGQQALRLMVASTVALAASIPVYLLQGIDAIDETWSVVVDRADAAGKELARSLLINNAGHRPVTLVGYSFGARVIFSCLKQLALYQQKWEEYQEEKDARAIGFATHDADEGMRTTKKERKWMLAELEFDREPASVVEDVVIIGAPLYLSLSSWRACRQIVAGRFVNVYSRKDRILSVMFKYKQLMESFKPVCGNSTVNVPGVENIDVTDLVDNHEGYVFMLSNILKRVRHGQPVRSSTNALDEEALLAEAEQLAAQQENLSELKVLENPLGRDEGENSKSS